MRTQLGLLLAASLFATSALADDVAVDEPTISRGQGWSVLSGKTVGNGNTVLAGQLGWPGISATLLHGVAPRLDIGGRLTFNYGEEGIVTRVVPGLKAQFVLRLQIVETSRINVGVHVAPGLMAYFEDPNFTRVGLALPFGVVLGLPVGSAVMINFGVDFPMHVFFGPGAGLNFPILVGAGAEYFVSSNLSVNFNLRMGTTLGAYAGYYGYYDYPRYRGYYTAPFTFEALFGVAYRF